MAFKGLYNNLGVLVYLWLSYYRFIMLPILIWQQ